MSELLPTETVNLANWPRDPESNRLLCAPAHPMPNGAAGRWAHMNVETVGSDSDFHYGTEWDRKRCKDCGLEWDQEVPQ